jgi:hypothetical protein
MKTIRTGGRVQNPEALLSAGSFATSMGGFNLAGGCRNTVNTDGAFRFGSFAT